MTEQEIFDLVYSMYSGDVDYWDSNSDEYALLRQYARAAIDRWRYYEQTDWKELFTTLADATTGSSVIVADTYVYPAPDDFVRNTGYVFIGGTKYTPITPSKAAQRVGDGSSDTFCWFTGNAKDGYALNLNPNIVYTAGQTIDYPYYKTPTYFDATTDVTEMSDPMYMVYFILSRLYKNDGEGYADEFNKAEAMLEQMRTKNMSGVEEVKNEIDWVSDEDDGFGY